MLLLQHSQLAVGHLQRVSADSHRAQGSKKVPATTKTEKSAVGCTSGTNCLQISGFAWE